MDLRSVSITTLLAASQRGRGGARARQTALGLSAESDIFRRECGQTPKARDRGLVCSNLSILCV